jgi:hypothetical protein
LTDDKIIEEGNASLLTEHLTKGDSTKIAFLGPHYFTDCMPLKSAKIGSSNWDSIAVVEEISLVDPSLECGKKADLGYNKKVWGQNWFSDQCNYNSDLEESENDEEESNQESSSVQLNENWKKEVDDDFSGEDIDQSLIKRPRVNYFVAEIDKCSRYAVAFAKNIKYLMGGVVPENSMDEFRILPNMGLQDPQVPSQNNDI